MTTPLTSEPERQYDAVARAIAFIRTHARQQPSLREIAAAVGLSEFHLQRLFSAWAGISPKRYLQYLTKERAKKALQHSADTLSAALDSGLSGPGRLHDLMITCEAMTPGEIKSGGAGLTVYHGLAPTPFGRALIGWTERGICYLVFVDSGGIEPNNAFSDWPAATLRRDDPGAVERAQRIFARRPRPGALHLLLKGTNFQLKVWEALIRIPPGQLISYGQLAQWIDVPRASRAVGSAVGANRIAYLIPCHRVIRGTGELGDYRWGGDRKLALQAWEAALSDAP